VIAIQPFVGRSGGEQAARLVEGIIAQDLKYSNRFLVSDQLPAAVGRDEVDYTFWNQMQASWLVTGRVEGAGSAAVLHLELHDVLFARVANRASIPLPSSAFRMAVHGASDEIVQWAFGEPGMAASRIVFSRPTGNAQELWVIDSDGENLQQLTRTSAAALGHAISLSPTWSPDGNRIAYISYKDTGNARLYELNLVTGRERVIPAPRSGLFLTPTYHPDGERLFFAIDEGNRGGIHSYNITRDCCFTTLMEGRSVEISPTFSPDGSAFAFKSSRLGVGAPQIYWAPQSAPTQAEILSPWEFGRRGYFNAPDWSPFGNRVAFHGWVDQRGANQILVAELNARNRLGRLLRVTLEGMNEDPSWSPDGRHLVYVGERSWGRGLFISDMLTPNSERVLVRGIEAGIPAWSPSLAP
jgi:TolB protein